jgi:CheY-like chemotaxis protein
MATVLVVDDDEDIRDVVRVNLELAGHEVVAVGDGGAALDAVGSVAVDVIVLDVLMPGIDGWEVLRRLKRDGSAASGVPVLMLTALGDQEDRLRGGIEGAIHYLAKPFDPAQVVGLVADLAAADEPAARRAVRRSSLAALARMDAGAAGTPDPDATVHLTRLERIPPTEPDATPPSAVRARARLGELTAVQRNVLETIASAGGVAEAARRLRTSRSNVYASLTRISRRLGLSSNQELLALLDDGSLLA